MNTMLKLAEAQLLGFAHASKGYSAKALVEAMGMTPKEWAKLRSKCTLKPSDIAEIDNHFSKSV